jgi:hypothetical protein
VPPEFYATAAQIAPVIVLAAVVEQAAVFNRATDPLMRAFSRFLLTVALGLLIEAEAVALYALASDSSTTFLFLTVAFALVSQFLNLVAMAHARYDPVFQPDEGDSKAAA